MPASVLEQRFVESVKPPQNPALLKALREKIPLINDDFDTDPAGTTKRWEGILAQIDRIHSGIIMEGQEENFEMNWQYGRILHNTGKGKDALHYLYQAQILEPENPKVAARTVEALLDVHKEYPNGGYLSEAQNVLSLLQELEASSYVDKVAKKVETTSQHLPTVPVAAAA